MATYINLGGAFGYLNAAAVVRFKTEQSSDRLQILTTAGTTESFHPSSTGDRSGEDILQDLLAALGSPERQPRTRLITLIDGKIDIRYLEH